MFEVLDKKLEQVYNRRVRDDGSFFPDPLTTFSNSLFQGSNRILQNHSLLEFTCSPSEITLLDQTNCNNLIGCKQLSMAPSVERTGSADNKIHDSAKAIEVIEDFFEPMADSELSVGDTMDDFLKPVTESRILNKDEAAKGLKMKGCSKPHQSVASNGSESSSKPLPQLCSFAQLASPEIPPLIQSEKALSDLPTLAVPKDMYAAGQTPPNIQTTHTHGFPLPIKKTPQFINLPPQQLTNDSQPPPSFPYNPELSPTITIDEQVQMVNVSQPDPEYPSTFLIEPQPIECLSSETAEKVALMKKYKIINWNLVKFYKDELKNIQNASPSLKKICTTLEAGLDNESKFVIKHGLLCLVVESEGEGFLKICIPIISSTDVATAFHERHHGENYEELKLLLKNTFRGFDPKVVNNVFKFCVKCASEKSKRFALLKQYEVNDWELVKFYNKELINIQNTSVTMKESLDKLLAHPDKEFNYVIKHGLMCSVVKGEDRSYLNICLPTYTLVQSAVATAFHTKYHEKNFDELKCLLFNIFGEFNTRTLKSIFKSCGKCKKAKHSALIKQYEVTNWCLVEFFKSQLEDIQNRSKFLQEKRAHILMYPCKNMRYAIKHDLVCSVVEGEGVGYLKLCVSKRASVEVAIAFHEKYHRKNAAELKDMLQNTFWRFDNGVVDHVLKCCVKCACANHPAVLKQYQVNNWYLVEFFKVRLKDIQNSSPILKEKRLTLGKDSKFVIKHDLICSVVEGEGGGYLKLCIPYSSSIEVADAFHKHYHNRSLEELKVLLLDTFWGFNEKVLEIVFKSCVGCTNLKQSANPKLYEVTNWDLVEFFKCRLEDIQKSSSTLNEKRAKLGAAIESESSFEIKHGLICAIVTGEYGEYLKICIPNTSSIEVATAFHNKYHNKSAVELMVLLLNTFWGFDAQTIEAVFQSCSECASEKSKKFAVIGTYEFNNWDLVEFFKGQLKDIQNSSSFLKDKREKLESDLDNDVSYVMKHGLICSAVDADDRGYLRICLPTHFQSVVATAFHKEYHEKSYKELKFMLFNIFGEFKASSFEDVFKSCEKNTVLECDVTHWDLVKFFECQLKIIQNSFEFLKEKRAKLRAFPCKDFEYVMKHNLVCIVSGDVSDSLKICIPPNRSVEVGTAFHDMYHDKNAVELKVLLLETFHDFDEKVLDTVFKSCVKCTNAKRALLKQYKVSNWNLVDFYKCRLEEIQNCSEVLKKKRAELRTSPCNDLEHVMKHSLVCIFVGDEVSGSLKVCIPSNQSLEVATAFHRKYHDMKSEELEVLLIHTFTGFDPKVMESVFKLCVDCRNAKRLALLKQYEVSYWDLVEFFKCRLEEIQNSSEILKEKRAELQKFPSKEFEYVLKHNLVCIFSGDYVSGCLKICIPHNCSIEVTTSFHEKYHDKNATELKVLLLHTFSRFDEKTVETVFKSCEECKYAKRMALLKHEINNWDLVKFAKCRLQDIQKQAEQRNISSNEFEYVTKYDLLCIFSGDEVSGSLKICTPPNQSVEVATALHEMCHDMNAEELKVLLLQTFYNFDEKVLDTVFISCVKCTNAKRVALLKQYEVSNWDLVEFFRNRLKHVQNSSSVLKEKRSNLEVEPDQDLNYVMKHDLVCSVVEGDGGGYLKICLPVSSSVEIAAAFHKNYHEKSADELKCSLLIIFERFDASTVENVFKSCVQCSSIKNWDLVEFFVSKLKIIQNSSAFMREKRAKLLALNDDDSNYVMRNDLICSVVKGEGNAYLYLCLPTYFQGTAATEFHKKYHEKSYEELKCLLFDIFGEFEVSTLYNVFKSCDLCASLHKVNRLQVIGPKEKPVEIPLASLEVPNWDLVEFFNYELVVIQNSAKFYKNKRAELQKFPYNDLKYVMKHNLVCFYVKGKISACLKICLPYNRNVDVAKVLHKKYHDKSVEELKIFMLHTFHGFDRAVMGNVFKSCVECIKTKNADLLKQYEISNWDLARFYHERLKVIQTSSAEMRRRQAKLIAHPEETGSFVIKHDLMCSVVEGKQKTHSLKICLPSYPCFQVTVTTAFHQKYHEKNLEELKSLLFCIFGKFDATTVEDVFKSCEKCVEQLEIANWDSVEFFRNQLERYQNFSLFLNEKRVELDAGLGRKSNVVMKHGLICSVVVGDERSYLNICLPTYAYIQPAIATAFHTKYHEKSVEELKSLLFSIFGEFEDASTLENVFKSCEKCTELYDIINWDSVEFFKSQLEVIQNSSLFWKEKCMKLERGLGRKSNFVMKHGLICSVDDVDGKGYLKICISSSFSFEVAIAFHRKYHEKKDEQLKLFLLNTFRGFDDKVVKSVFDSCIECQNPKHSNLLTSSENVGGKTCVTFNEKSERLIPTTIGPLGLDRKCDTDVEKEAPDKETVTAQLISTTETTFSSLKVYKPSEINDRFLNEKIAGKFINHTQSEKISDFVVQKEPNANGGSKKVIVKKNELDHSEGKSTKNHSTILQETNEKSKCGTPITLGKSNKLVLSGQDQNERKEKSMEIQSTCWVPSGTDEKACHSMAFDTRVYGASQNIEGVTGEETNVDFHVVAKPSSVYAEPDGLNIANYDKFQSLNEKLVAIQNSSVLGAVKSNLLLTDCDIDEDQYFVKHNLLCKRSDCSMLEVILPPSPSIYGEIVSSLSELNPDLEFSELTTLANCSFSYVLSKNVELMKDFVNKKIINLKRVAVVKQYEVTNWGLIEFFKCQLKDIQKSSTFLKKKLADLQTYPCKDLRYAMKHDLVCSVVEGEAIGYLKLCVPKRASFDVATAFHEKYHDKSAEELEALLSQTFWGFEAKVIDMIFKSCVECTKIKHSALQKQYKVYNWDLVEFFKCRLRDIQNSSKFFKGKRAKLQTFQCKDLRFLMKHDLVCSVVEGGSFGYLKLCIPISSSVEVATAFHEKYHSKNSEELMHLLQNTFYGFDDMAVNIVLKSCNKCENPNSLYQYEVNNWGSVKFFKDRLGEIQNSSSLLKQKRTKLEAGDKEPNFVMKHDLVCLVVAAEERGYLKVCVPHNYKVEVTTAFYERKVEELEHLLQSTFWGFDDRAVVNAFLSVECKDAKHSALLRQYEVSNWDLVEFFKNRLEVIQSSSPLLKEKRAKLEAFPGSELNFVMKRGLVCLVVEGGGRGYLKICVPNSYNVEVTSALHEKKVEELNFMLRNTFWGFDDKISLGNVICLKQTHNVFSNNYTQIEGKTSSANQFCESVSQNTLKPLAMPPPELDGSEVDSVLATLPKIIIDRIVHAQESSAVVKSQIQLLKSGEYGGGKQMLRSSLLCNSITVNRKNVWRVTVPPTLLKGVLKHIQSLHEYHNMSKNIFLEFVNKFIFVPRDSIINTAIFEPFYKICSRSQAGCSNAKILKRIHDQLVSIYKMVPEIKEWQTNCLEIMNIRKSVQFLPLSLESSRYFIFEGLLFANHSNVDKNEVNPYVLPTIAVSQIPDIEKLLLTFFRSSYHNVDVIQTVNILSKVLDVTIPKEFFLATIQSNSGLHMKETPGKSKLLSENRNYQAKENITSNETKKIVSYILKLFQLFAKILPYVQKWQQKCLETKSIYVSVQNKTPLSSDKYFVWKGLLFQNVSNQESRNELRGSDVLPKIAVSQITNIKKLLLVSFHFSYCKDPVEQIVQKLSKAFDFSFGLSIQEAVLIILNSCRKCRKFGKVMTNAALAKEGIEPHKESDRIKIESKSPEEPKLPEKILPRNEGLPQWHAGINAMLISINRMIPEVKKWQSECQVTTMCIYKSLLLKNPRSINKYFAFEGLIFKNVSISEKGANSALPKIAVSQIMSVKRLLISSFHSHYPNVPVNIMASKLSESFDLSFSLKELNAIILESCQKCLQVGRVITDTEFVCLGLMPHQANDGINEEVITTAPSQSRNTFSSGSKEGTPHEHPSTEHHPSVFLHPLITSDCPSESVPVVSSRAVLEKELEPSTTKERAKRKGAEHSEKSPKTRKVEIENTSENHTGVRKSADFCLSEDEEYTITRRTVQMGAELVKTVVAGAQVGKVGITSENEVMGVTAYGEAIKSKNEPLEQTTKANVGRIPQKGHEITKEMKPCFKDKTKMPKTTQVEKIRPLQIRQALVKTSRTRKRDKSAANAGEPKLEIEEELKPILTPVNNFPQKLKVTESDVTPNVDPKLLTEPEIKKKRMTQKHPLSKIESPIPLVRDKIFMSQD